MSNINSSYTYNSCQPMVSSDCVSWQGDNIPCLGICNGQSITQIELQITSAICTLLGDVDMSTIIIPDCLKTAWASKDPTILKLLQFVLDQACVQKAQLDALQTEVNTINPLVTVDYKCCSGNPCVTTGTVTLSVALQNIISCICDLNGQIAEFNAEVAILTEGLNSLNTQVADIQQFILNQTALNTTFGATLQSLQNTTSCLKTGILGAVAFPINVSSC